MKRLCDQIKTCVVVIAITFSPFTYQLKAQTFQQVYGTQLDNSFSKVIKDGASYFVLGQDESVNGSPLRATVSRIDANGIHQWTLSLDIASSWNDAVLISPGELMVVGNTLPFDPTTKSLIGRVTVTGGGNFAWLQMRDWPGRDAFIRVAKNPLPQNAAFPYYVVGTQNQPGGTATTEDVVLWNFNAAGGTNWKKKYLSQGDDEFFRDMEPMTNGDLLLAGNDATGKGLIFRTDNTGTAFNGVEIAQLSFTDVALETLGGVYATANSLNSPDAHLLRFDADLLLIYDVIIPQLSTITQVWEGQPGEVFVVGRGNFGPQNRTVLIKLVDASSFGNISLTVDWVKFLSAGTGSTGGGYWPMPNGDIAYADARTITGGFGQNCAFLAISDHDLTNCQVVTDMVTLVFADQLPNGPLPPELNFEDILQSTTLVASALNWQQQEVCNLAPCAVSITATPQNNCGLLQFCANATGPQPYSYQWSNSQNTQCITVQLPCGQSTYSVSVTCSDGTVATDSETISVSDNTPPTALCSGVGVDLDPVTCQATITASLIDGGSSDNCFIQNMSVSPSVVTGCGLHPVTLTVTDWCGNQSTCTAQVQALEVVPPVLTCPVNAIKQCNTNTSPQFCGTATAIDNCDPSPTITFTDITTGLIPCDGTIQRTWKAEDDCGNVSTCVQNITVIDNVPPVIQCPQGYSTECNVNVGPNVTGFATATDNCTPTANITITNTDLLFSDLVPNGFCDNHIERTWKATDGCGNMATCVQVINVHDDVPPTLTNCPGHLSVQGMIGPNGVCNANVQITSPTATDNCDATPTLFNSFNNSANASGIYPSGLTTVTWTCVDDCGNVRTCVHEVVVECQQQPPQNDKCGWTVATCYSDNPADPVGVIYDTRYNSSATAGADWGTSLNPGSIHPPDWKGSIIGSVFGIALDPLNERIYLAASDVYKYDAGYLNTYTGPGGRAAVYRTDCAPPYATTNIVTTLNAPTIPSNSGNMLPNTGGIGNGIGNICHDIVHNQLFLSNLEDGRIYRIDLNGNILSAYDPFALTNGLTGMEPVPERIWGIGFNKSQNRVYYAMEGLTASQKFVYSVNLTSAGEFAATPAGGGLFTDATPNPEVTTSVPGNQLKFTDIAFGQLGNKMLLAERGNPHASLVFEFDLVGTTWVASPNDYFVGGFSGKNSAGGVDYGYKEQGGSPTAICDGLVWTTGNYMMTNTLGILVYGMEGISAAAGNTSPGNELSDIFIDYDGVYNTLDKNEIADVEVFKCGCPGQASVCDSISVTSMPFNSQAQDTCCFKLTVDNQKPNFFTAIQLCTGNGVSFSNVSALNGCILNSYSASQVTIVPTGGIPNTFPVGSKDFLKFCLSNYQTVPSQQVIVKYYGPNFEIVCMDTLTYNCTQKPKCLKLTPDVTCGPNGTYKMDFCVMSDALIPFTVGSFTLNPPSGSGITFTPSVFVPSPPLVPGNMQCGFSTSISGAVDGQTFCFSVTAHQQNIAQGEPTLNCCTDTVMLVCVTMPDCVCDKVFADTMSVNSPDGDCCWKLNLTNNYSNTYFTGVQLEICTPGVVFGAINNPGFTWGLNSNTTLATFTPIPGPFIGATATLPTFCLSGITGPAQVPQMVVLKWLGPNMKVVCTDTMLFDCPWPDTTDCAVLVCPKLACDPTTNGVYNFSFQVQNNAGFTVNQVNLNSVTGCGFIVPTQFSIGALANGGTSSTLSAQVFGCSPGQQFCFTLTVHEVAPNGNELNCCTHSQQYCFTLPTCGFCPGNLVQNGDFEIGAASINDEDIFLATSWSGIWPDGPNPVSTADFWNTFTFNNTVLGTIPLPLTQNNYAGMWCKLHGSNQVWREGILNNLFSPVAANSGSYHFELKVACLTPVLPNANSVLPSLSVFGVDAGSVSTGAPGPLAPLNTGLFNGLTPVLLGNIVLPSTCDINFGTHGFTFNANTLPVGFSMDRIFITRTDGVGSDVYLAIDDVSLKAVDTCCVWQSDLTLSANGVQYPVFCDPHTGFLPSLPCPVGDVTVSGFFGSLNPVTGEPCEETTVNWVFTHPDSTVTNGTSTNFTDFFFPKDSVDKPGLYCLTLTSISSTGDTCFCKVSWVQEACDSCCTSYEDFCDRLENNVTLTVDPDLCKATLNVGDIGCDDYIEWVNWGVGTPPIIDFGPFPPGSMPMHTYPGSGTYAVCYLAIERDSNGLICFEKVVCDTITLVCSDSCCTNFDAFVQAVDAATSITVDNALCKATLNIGDLPCDDYIESINWGDGQSSFGPFASGSMPMHTYPTSGTYTITYLAIERDPVTGLICFEKVFTETISVMCPTCHCGDFDKMFMRTKKGAPSIAMHCGQNPVQVGGCPLPGQSLSFTGVFHCAGPDCPATAQVDWKLVRLPNTTVAMGSTTANPFFGVNILPNWYATPGTYELQLTGICGLESCPCNIKFTVGCPNQCPCTPADIQALQAAVNQGFSIVKYPTSCKACFAPVALSDCEEVVWHLNSASGPVIGTSVGNGSICHTFTNGGTYTVVMVVTRKKPDGSLCEVFVHQKTVTITCLAIEECTDSDFPNPAFAEGAIGGGMLSGGASTGWTALSGEPKVVEGEPGSFDAWTIELSGNFDTAGVLATMEPVCLEKTSGTITMRAKEPSGLGARVRPCDIAKWTPNFPLHGRYTIPLSGIDGPEWVEIEIPFDLSYWPDLEICNSSEGGVWVQPAFYLENALGNNQGGEDTYSYLQVDNLCIDGQPLNATHSAAKERAIRLYPNPTSGTLTLEFMGNLPGSGGLQVLDIYGRKLLAETLLPGRPTHQFSLSALPAGMYFVQVLEEGQAVWSEKVVKQ